MKKKPWTLEGKQHYGLDGLIRNVMIEAIEEYEYWKKTEGTNNDGSEELNSLKEFLLTKQNKVARSMELRFGNRPSN